MSIKQKQDELISDIMNIGSKLYDYIEDTNKRDEVIKLLDKVHDKIFSL